MSPRELIREEVEDSLSMRFRDDNSAAPQQQMRLALFRPTARKEAQIVLTDESRISSKGVKIAKLAAGRFLHGVDCG